MAITALRWVQHAEWPDGGPSMSDSNLAQLQFQESGGPWQTVQLVLRNNAGEERDGGVFSPSGQ
jgi:hypothetical protein